VSDVLTIQPDNALIATSSIPAFVSRLRSGRFISPAGFEFSFLFDSLSRTRGKKTAAHEITDSDETVIQSLGSGLQVFPMSIYFVGENCDTLSDAFCNAIWNEKYTPDSPGILNHPRWGDVPVIPFGDVEQTEEFVNGAGISRVSIVFRETKSLVFIDTAESSSLTIGRDVGKVKVSTLDRASKMVTNSKASYAKFKAVIRNAVKTVTDAIDAVESLVQSISSEIEAITQDIYAAIDEAASPIIILAQVQDLITLVAEVPSKTVEIVNAYIDMANGLVSGFDSDITNASTIEDKQNISLVEQAIVSIADCGVALASINVDYETRDDVSVALDGMVDSYLAYLAMLDNAVNSLSTQVTKTFLPDHDTTSGVHGVIFNTQALLLFRSFSLKSRRTYSVVTNSDPLSLTWKYYGDLSQLAFFCKTNKIVGNEFIEIPAGRSLVIYE